MQFQLKSMISTIFSLSHCVIANNLLGQSHKNKTKRKNIKKTNNLKKICLPCSKRVVWKAILLKAGEGFLCKRYFFLIVGTIMISSLI
jgi:hypothetical protein